MSTTRLDITYEPFRLRRVMCCRCKNTSSQLNFVFDGPTKQQKRSFSAPRPARRIWHSEQSGYLPVPLALYATHKPFNRAVTAAAIALPGSLAMRRWASARPASRILMNSIAGWCVSLSPKTADSAKRCDCFPSIPRKFVKSHRPRFRLKTLGSACLPWQRTYVFMCLLEQCRSNWTYAKAQAINGFCTTVHRITHRITPKYTLTNSPNLPKLH